MVARETIPIASINQAVHGNQRCALAEDVAFVLRVSDADGYYYCVYIGTFSSLIARPLSPC